MTDLVTRAAGVLESNWLGHATRPGPHLCPCFDPTTGDGLGSQSFSWTAALAIDMAAAA